MPIRLGGPVASKIAASFIVGIRYREKRRSATHEGEKPRAGRELPQVTRVILTKGTPGAGARATTSDQPGQEGNSLRENGI